MSTTSQKPLLFAALSFVITFGLMLFVCANAHIDFFPCERTMKDFARADPFTGEAPLVTQEGTCSLMGHLREPIDGERDKLTGAGWALLLAFCGGIAAMDSVLIYSIMNKKLKA